MNEMEWNALSSVVWAGRKGGGSEFGGRVLFSRGE